MSVPGTEKRDHILHKSSGLLDGGKVAPRCEHRPLLHGQAGLHPSPRAQNDVLGKADASHWCLRRDPLPLFYLFILFHLFVYLFCFLRVRVVRPIAGPPMGDEGNRLAIDNAPAACSRSLRHSILQARGCLDFDTRNTRRKRGCVKVGESGWEVAFFHAECSPRALTIGRQM